MNDKEAMKLALEALEAVGAEFVCQATHHNKKDQHGGLDDCPNQVKHKKAITALKERLAQPEQEHPVYSPFISCELWRLRK